ncbi:motile sperm domain-containing protein 2, partial [Ixodes scapularis]
MVQLKQQQNGDTFGETEYLVSRADIEDFRKGIEEEAQRDPDQFHPADVQKLTDSDELCRRFIRQKRRNVEDAVAMAKAALCWRKTFEEKLPFREYTWDDVDFLINAASPKVISERIPRTKEIEEFYRSRFGMFDARSTTATEDAVTLIKV